MKKRSRASDLTKFGGNPNLREEPARERLRSTSMMYDFSVGTQVIISLAEHTLKYGIRETKGKSAFDGKDGSLIGVYKRLNEACKELTVLAYYYNREKACWKGESRFILCFYEFCEYLYTRLYCVSRLASNLTYTQCYVALEAFLLFMKGGSFEQVLDGVVRPALFGMIQLSSSDAEHTLQRLQGEQYKPVSIRYLQELSNA